MPDETNLDEIARLENRHAQDTEFWEELKEEVFERSDATVIVDQNGMVFRVNREAELVFGYSRREILNQSVDILVPSEARSVHGSHRQGYSKEPRQRLMGQGSVLKGRRKDGTEFEVEISLSPVPTTRGIFTIATVRRARARQ